MKSKKNGIYSKKRKLTKKSKSKKMRRKGGGNLHPYGDESFMHPSKKKINNLIKESKKYIKEIETEKEKLSRLEQPDSARINDLNYQKLQKEIFILMQERELLNREMEPLKKTYFEKKKKKIDESFMPKIKKLELELDRLNKEISLKEKYKKLYETYHKKQEAGQNFIPNPEIDDLEKQIQELEQEMQQTNTIS